MRVVLKQVRMQTFRFHKKDFTERIIWTGKYADSSPVYGRLCMNKRKFSVLHSSSPLCYLEKSKHQQSEGSGRLYLMLIMGLEILACIVLSYFHLDHSHLHPFISERSYLNACIYLRKVVCILHFFKECQKVTINISMKFA